MKAKLRTSVLLSILLFFLLGGNLLAQAYGRLVLEVENAAGEPLGDVAVKVTSEAMSNFLLEETTNKKGKVTLTFTDATLTYVVHLTKEGYRPLEAEVKAAVQSSKTETLVMQKPDASPAGGNVTEGGEMIFTPAQEAFNAGVEAKKAGDDASARQKFLEARELDPQMPQVHSALAGVFLEEENYEEAVASATRLLEFDPSNLRAQRVLYEAHSKLGNRKEAADALKEISQADAGEDTAAMMYNEGVATLNVGDIKEATKRFEEALVIQPDLAPAMLALTLIHYNDSNHQGAVEMAEKLLAVEPGNQKAKEIRYESYKALGNEAKTEEAFQALAADRPELLATEIYNAGAALFNSGKHVEAKAKFEEALQLDPNLARAHYYIGLAYVNMEQPAQAKQELQKFLEMAPEDPEAPAAREMLNYL